jgi:four helix bundle protein
MKKEDLFEQIRHLSVRIVKLTDTLPETKAARIIATQLLRSATSIGANYHAACFAKSKRDFINKLKIAEEETDETIYWLDLVQSCNWFPPGKIVSLRTDFSGLMAIIVASIKTAKANLGKGRNN